jgi:hypothetical protein
LHRPDALPTFSQIPGIATAEKSPTVIADEMLTTIQEGMSAL